MQPLVQQGIDAYNAGNKVEALRLLKLAAQQNRNDETAWYYLGLAFDDEPSKRRSFQQVLTINPNNQQAKAALAELGAATSVPPADSTARTAPDIEAPRMQPLSSSASSSGSSFTGQGFKNPINVEGAPATLTLPYVIQNTQARVRQGIGIYTTRDMDYYYQAAQGATMWDAVFMVGVAAVAAGAAQFFGRLIGFFLGGFFTGVGGLLISPIVYGVAALVGTAAGFFAGLYAADWYLKNEKINVPLSQQAMYYALLFLPLTLIGAALSFITNALGFLVLCLLPLLLPLTFVLAIYNWYLLRQAMERAYSLLGNKAWIAAAIAIFGGFLTSAILQSIITGVFRR